MISIIHKDKVTFKKCICLLLTPFLFMSISCSVDKSKESVTEKIQSEDETESLPAAPGFGIYEIYTNGEIGESVKKVLAGLNSDISFSDYSESSAIAFVAPSDTTGVNTALAVAKQHGAVSSDVTFVWSLTADIYPDYDHPDFYALFALKGERAFDPALVADISKETSSLPGNRVSDICLLVKATEEGAEVMRKLTEENIGRPLAIVIDNHVISTPTVTCPIEGGAIQICMPDSKTTGMVFDCITASSGE